MKLTQKHLFWIKVAIHFLNIVFFASLLYLTFSYQFGADPIEGITHFTGIAAINTLFITMMISPLARWTKQGLIVQCRRLMGLYCFFWATLHMLIYFSLDLGFNFSLLGEEIIHRPYLTLGAISWVILLALALTSTKKIQKQMGKKWQKLHNTAYLILVLTPIHFYWSAKSEVMEPFIYLILAFVLLGLRWKRIKRIFLPSRDEPPQKR